jgi:hypothetical protein
MLRLKASLENCTFSGIGVYTGAAVGFFKMDFGCGSTTA